MSVFVAMSAALATIFSLEKSRKWIIRDGLNGDLGQGFRRPDGQGLEEVSRVAHVTRRGYRGRLQKMTNVETDQAAREATGAHPYGRYLEEFEVGAVYKHWPAKTVTEADDHLFCLITMNHHPLHINDVYAAQSQQGRNVVVGPLVYSLALGMSVSDVSGKAIANLATEELKHPAPGLPRRHAVLRVRGARGQALALQARSRHREGPHPGPEPGRRAGRGVQAARARAAQARPEPRPPRGTSSSASEGVPSGMTKSRFPLGTETRSSSQP